VASVCYLEPFLKNREKTISNDSDSQRKHRILTSDQFTGSSLLVSILFVGNEFSESRENELARSIFENLED